jgi:hypothetical protein
MAFADPNSVVPISLARAGDEPSSFLGRPTRGGRAVGEDIRQVGLRTPAEDRTREVQPHMSVAASTPVARTQAEARTQPEVRTQLEVRIPAEARMPEARTAEARTAEAPRTAMARTRLGPDTPVEGRTAVEGVQVAAAPEGSAQGRTPTVRAECHTDQADPRRRAASRPVARATMGRGAIRMGESTPVVAAANPAASCSEEPRSASCRRDEYV